MLSLHLLLLEICIIIETCLQMLLLLYQKECLPTMEGCIDCKFVKDLYTADTTKSSLHWFSRYDKTKY